LHPLPRVSRTHVFAAPSFLQAARFVADLRASTLAVTGLQLSAADEGPPTVAVRVEGSSEGVEASTMPLAEKAATCGLASSHDTPNPCGRSECLWEFPGTVAKVTFPPSQLAHVCTTMPRTRWTLVAQGAGAGLLATSAESDDVAELARRLGAAGGSLTVLRGDVALKQRVNGTALEGALPLMKRVKEQFDPASVLNPGVLAGGI
jgi:glycolate oxidase FAD binding subunit